MRQQGILQLVEEGLKNERIPPYLAAYIKAELREGEDERADGERVWKEEVFARRS